MTSVRRCVPVVAGVLLLVGCSGGSRSGPSPSLAGEPDAATAPSLVDGADPGETTSGVRDPGGSMPVPGASGPVSGGGSGEATEQSSVVSSVSSVVSSAVPSTAVTTTVDAVLRAALVAALPTVADLPATWTLAADAPSFTLVPGVGDFVGACGGANADRRALDSGVLAVAHGADYESPTAFGGYVSVYAFGDDRRAAEFVTRTRSVSSCSRSYSVREGSAPGEYDGFGDTSYDRVVRWAVTETTATASPDWTGSAFEAGDGAAIVMTREDALSTTSDSTSFAAVETAVTLYEQHGRLVLVASLSSYCCTSGYRNPAGTRRVTWLDLRAVVDPLRNRVAAAAASLR